MLLENKLAKIDSLVDEIDSRTQNDGDNTIPFNGPHCDKAVYLDALKHESALLAKNALDGARNLNKKNTHKSSENIGAVCVRAKNLTDTMNQFLQFMYGTGPISLKNLRTNTSRAPMHREKQESFLRSNGCSLPDLITRTHKRDGELVRLRNLDSHGQGVEIVQKTPNGNLTIGENHYHEPDEWITWQAVKYLDMTASILETIVQKDSEVLGPSNPHGLKLPLWMRTTQKWMDHYGSAVKTIGATALLVGGILGGSLGTMAYQNNEAKKTMESRRNMMKYSLMIQSGLSLDSGEHVDQFLLELQLIPAARSEIIKGMGEYLNTNHWAYVTARKQILEEIKSQSRDIGLILDESYPYIKGLWEDKGEPIPLECQVNFDVFNSARKSFSNNLEKAMDDYNALSVPMLIEERKALKILEYKTEVKHAVPYAHHNQMKRNRERFASGELPVPDYLIVDAHGIRNVD